PCRRSAIAAPSVNIGISVKKRNSWSSSTFSRGDDVSKGGWEWIVAHNANSASTRSVAAEPPGPNRTAAQSRNGNGAYKNTTGVLAAGNRWVKTRTQVRSRPAVRIAASRRHFREVCHHTNGSTVAAWRITGTSVIVASAFEYKRMRHRLQ